MISPTRCPFCNDILVTAYHRVSKNTSLEMKSCDKRIDHRIQYTLNTDGSVYSFRIPLLEKSNATWYPNNQLLIIYKEGTGATVNIPYFEVGNRPFAKLVHKVKTYITFS